MLPLCSMKMIYHLSRRETKQTILFYTRKVKISSKFESRDKDKL